jgi:DNA-binding protein H-NS
MISLSELIKQKEALESQIALVRQSEQAEAISKIKTLIAEYELTQEDIFGGSKRAPKEGGAVKVAPKYRDPETGATWTGRGKRPKWIEGKDLALFAI